LILGNEKRCVYSLKKGRLFLPVKRSRVVASLGMRRPLSSVEMKGNHTVL
jgi:hypothetical protein